MANYDEHKLKAIGLLKAGYSAKEVSRELKVPYPKILKWKPEADNIQTKQDLEAVLSTDKAVLHELADNVRDKLDELAEDGGEIVTATLEKIDKLQILQVDLQESAIKLIERVNAIIDDCKRPDDILVLVDAISKLQTSFFAKGANVNILNAPGNGQASDTGMSAFKSLQRPV